MKKKRRRTRSSKLEASQRGPFFAAHPLNRLSQEDRRAYVVAAGERARARFKTLLSELDALLSRVEPLLTLSVLESYALMTVPGKDNSSDGPRVQQGHVEFLQAMFLRQEGRGDLELATPADIQMVFDALPEIFETQLSIRLPTADEVERDESPEHTALKAVQEYLRAHTAVVRNWGFFGAMTRIATEQFRPMDVRFEAVFGLKLTDVVRLFEHLVRRQEQEVNEHWKLLHGVLRGKDIARAVDDFFEAFPFDGQTDEWAASVKDGAATVGQMQAALLPLADRYLTLRFFLTTNALANELQVDEAALGNLLDSLSLPLASLKGVPPEGLFAQNPVWLRPFIALGKGQYFCALPQTAMSFVYPIVDELLGPHQALIAKLSDTRAGYLEAEVQRLFRAAFPGAEIETNYKWQSGDQEFESDLVLRYDTTILLAEAKSGRVTWPALRGAPGRLIEHVKKLIVDPSDQSGRLASALEREIALRKAGGSPELNFPLRLDGVTTVLRLSVTLHYFATLQSVPTMLQDAGVLKNEYPLAPCMSLADLEVMLDLLEEPYVRMHYIRQRASTFLAQHVIGDELDMLGFYLDTGLNFGGLEPGKQRLMATSYSARIDKYYLLRDEGLPAKKPTRSISVWLKSLCKQISNRPTQGWSEMTSALLSIMPKDQLELERRVRSIAKRIREGRPLPKGHDAVVLGGPPWAKTSLVVQARQLRGGGRANQHAEQLASVAFEQDHVERCCVIIVDAEISEMPYLGGSVWYRTDRAVPTTLFM